MATVVEKAIQSAVMAILVDAELELGGRAVTVWGYWPEAFRQDQTPLVVVEQASESSMQPFDSSRGVGTYVTAIWLVDGMKASPLGEEEAEGRLNELLRQVRSALNGEPNLRLAWRGVLPGSWRLSRVGGDPEVTGNNLMRLGLSLEVTALVGETET